MPWTETTRRLGRGMDQRLPHPPHNPPPRKVLLCSAEFRFGHLEVSRRALSETLALENIQINIVINAYMTCRYSA